MDELFFDRFNDKLVRQLPKVKAIPGRWLLRTPQGKDIFLNSVAVQSGAFLVPELSGDWRVTDGEGSVEQGRMLRKLDPEEVEAESIRTMGQHLDELIGREASWDEWLNLVPLVPNVSTVVNLLDLEQRIQELFGHLKAVCTQPRAHLHVEVERVPIARARRLPIKAAAYLASHTEDWERPLIRGVLPKRILSEVRQDQVDIYENRVAARLIDHLVVYLAKRIRVIRKLLKVFQDKEDYSSAVGGTYFRQRRICELWGQFIDADEGRWRAEATLKELEQLKYRLMGLMDSSLYRNVPRRTYVAPTLRTTNILANDQNYYRVAELWRAWVDAGQAETKTAADVKREAQELCRGIGSFALLLVLRSLAQLGYTIGEQNRTAPVTLPGCSKLEGHGATVICKWDAAGRICIEIGKNRLTMVALPVSLGTATSDEQVEEVVERIGAAIDDRTGRTIVLYAGDAEVPGQKLSPLVQRRIHTVGNDPGTEFGDRIGFLPVSPWDIGSVERISRAIRWFADSARFDCYPLEITVPPEARGVVDPRAVDSWLKISDKGDLLTICRPPRKHEWNLLKIDQLVEKAQEKHQQASIEHEERSAALNEAVRKGKTGTLNAEKKAAHQREMSTERRMKAVEQLRNELVSTLTKAESLLVCPACGTAADPGSDFKARTKSCFRCDCQSCKTFWATRMCKNGHRYAVMLPGGKFVETDDTASGWEDRIYGRDLLALPGRTEDSWEFVCPSCGETS